MRKLCKFIKAMAVVLAAGQILTLYHPLTVKAGEETESDGQNNEEIAEEFNPDGSGVVWSEPEVEGWTLSWTSEGFFDTLVSAQQGDVSIQYTYDEKGMRNSKTVNGVTTYYDYLTDELYGSRLLSETTGNDTIRYEYEFSTEKYAYVPTGFSCSGTEYAYVYDDSGVITGVAENGVQIVKYQYFNDICEQTLGLDENGCWADRTAEEGFIGNVNPFRYMGYYLDEETGWYYLNRYYSAGGNRFVDGVSPARAEELKLYYPEYEVNTKTYTSGVNVFSAMGRSTALSESETVARVILLESQIYKDDQKCVAAVIRGRMQSDDYGFAGVTTAYQVVSQEMEGEPQFSTFRKIEEDFPSQIQAHPQTWAYAQYLASLLVNAYSLPATPSGYSGQLFFSSVKRFLDTEPVGTTNTFRIGNCVYSNCWMMEVGAITYDMFADKENIFGDYIGSEEPAEVGSKFGYNVFCHKQFNQVVVQEVWN